MAPPLDVGTKTATPKSIVELVERFERNREAYKSGQYNETQLRREFLDPFFEALGWDVNNKQGHAEAYKDVIHEDTIKVGGATKAPDYCFRIGGMRKFFVEAKKPSISLREDPSPAFQLRRYAWSAKLPLSLLTDFDEFVVYDCRIKPAKTEQAAAARILYLTSAEYLQRWEEIASIFSHDAVLKGSFDRYAESSRVKKGTAEVDDAFLEEIESWRELLAHNLALRNPTLTQRELNFAIQRTIDRVIFLRICEDRGIEEYGRLLSLLNGANIYPRLCEFFHRADERYNSGLFHFRKEKDRLEQPDELTLHLMIEDKPLREIIKNLYYPDSPYEFSVLPADMLGHVYEQFLGKVIRLTAGHRAVVEDKPEVKKAGGVYYTPTYIVNYIVKHTVGKLLESKTPKQVSKLRILDPACGSGSFLIGAYQHLLDWHRDRYVADGPQKHTKELYQGPGGDWRLTTAERKRILLNNIYGVDIDPQAVEVTKLSLLLKVLESENEQTLERQLKLFHERALPDLGDNIKCGNSLIGPDFYNGQQMTLFDDEERYRINVLDWKAEFQEIMKNGGFDAVIGNPPYIGFHGFADQKEYLRLHFLSAQGKFDFYLPFIEQSLRLLREHGILGFICPTNFMKRGHGAGLRRYLKDTARIAEIVDFQDVQIFKRALNYTGIFLIEKAHAERNHRIRYKPRDLSNSGFDMLQRELGEEAWVFQNSEVQAIVERVRQQHTSPLGGMTAGISEGIVTGQNEVFLLPRSLAKDLGLESDLLRPCVRGKQIRSYWLSDAEEVVIYPYRLIGNRTMVIPENELKQFPKIWSYLDKRRPDLAGRKYFEKSSKEWYELWCQRDLRLLAMPKILVPELAESNRFALANGSQFYGDTVCGITSRPEISENINYVLGLLNSHLLEFFYKSTTVPKANQFYIYKTMFLKNVPVRRINFSDDKDSARHDRMVGLVERMLALHKQLAAAKTPDEKTALQRQIAATDSQIDRLVYELYGLTDEEIKVVEEATR